MSVFVCLTGTVALADVPVIDAQLNQQGWSRVNAQTVQLAWDWNWEWVPETAVQAELTLHGLYSTVHQTFQKPTTHYLWTVYTDETSFREDSFQTTLAFLDAGGTVLTNMITRLDVLTGSFLGAEVKTASTESYAWKKASRPTLLFYDSTWTSATVNAVEATLLWMKDDVSVFSTNLINSASGFYPWRNNGWDSGEYKIDLSFDGSETPTWTAYVCLQGGMVIVVR